MSMLLKLAPLALVCVAAPAAAQTTDVSTLPATKSGKLAAAPADKAQVVFYRPGSLMGAALGCTIYDNGQQIARLGNGKYWVHLATPGKILFNTKAENTDQLTLEVEPGETYFVKCKIGMGVMSGRPNISPATAEEFSGKAKGLKLWEPEGKAAAELGKKAE